MDKLCKKKKILLLRNVRFVLDEIVFQNASKFCHIFVIRKSNKLFFLFLSPLCNNITTSCAYVMILENLRNCADMPQFPVVLGENRKDRYIVYI